MGYPLPYRRVISVPRGCPISGPDNFTLARIVKVGLVNPEVDLGQTHDTAWHGIAARGFPNWKVSGPKFREDLKKRTSHGGSVYVTPAFEHAVAYGFRGIVSPEAGRPAFAAMHTARGEKWNYILIMQVAIFDRGTAGVVEEKQKTFPAAPSDGWDDEAIEWVVHDVSKAQIYGILFCFFPDAGYGA